MEEIKAIKFLPLRCGLCNMVVRGTWEKHLESKEHKFRVQQLVKKMYENQHKWGTAFIVDATKEVRETVNAPEVVTFD